MRCEKCNNEMNYFQENQTCGWTCPQCRNSIATTYVSNLQLDETLYTLSGGMLISFYDHKFGSGKSVGKALSIPLQLKRMRTFMGSLTENPVR